MKAVGCNVPNKMQLMTAVIHLMFGRLFYSSYHLSSELQNAGKPKCSVGFQLVGRVTKLLNGTNLFYLEALNTLSILSLHGLQNDGGWISM